MKEDPVRVVAEALRGTGLGLVGACSVAAYDARASAGLKSGELMSRTRGVVVLGGAGRDLWWSFRAAQAASPEHWEREHPLDAHVASLLDRADRALAIARIGSRRFEPTLHAAPALDFRALGEMAGLGTLGPFGLLIHPEHGPWWALRAAWLVDVSTHDPAPLHPPCAGCSAPCVGTARAGAGAGAIVHATPDVRSRCVLGHASRYEAEQIAYHYEHGPTLARLRREAEAT